MPRWTPLWQSWTSPLPPPNADGLWPSPSLGERSATFAVSLGRTAPRHWRGSAGSSGAIQASTCIRSRDIRGHHLGRDSIAQDRWRAVGLIGSHGHLQNRDPGFDSRSRLQQI